jgi:antitoxin HicB
MRGYPVNLRRSGKFIVVSFPDIPEAHTQGIDRAEALEMAKEALELSMEFYFDDNRPVPMPSRPKRGQAVVELPPSRIGETHRNNQTGSQPTHRPEALHKDRSHRRRAPSVRQAPILRSGIKL